MATDSAGNDNGRRRPTAGRFRFQRWSIAACLGVFTAVNIILIVVDAPTEVRLIPSGLLLAAALGAAVAVLLRRARN